jgi:hypothetical protein
MSDAETRKTLSIIALALLIGYYLFKIVILQHLALGLLILTAFPNPLAKMLARAWLKFSETLGRINSRILLTLTYFTVLVPVALLYRPFNRKTIDYFNGKKLDSYFMTPDRNFSREFFEKSW